MPRCLRCGTDNKATARFCRQCGAAMPDLASVEDDDSTVIIPSTGPGAAEAPAAPERSTPRSGPAAAQQAESRTPRREDPNARSVPAAPGGRRLGLGLVTAVMAVLAVVVYLVWSATTGISLFSPEPAPPAAGTAAQPLPAPEPPPPAASPAPPSPPQAPVQEALPMPPPVAPPPPVEETPPPPAVPAAETPPPATVPPKQAVKDEGPAKADAEQAARERKAEEARAKREARAEKKRREAAERARRAAERQAASAPAPAPPPPPADPDAGRWSAMKQELDACGAINVICRERVRWKYCSGRWGKVPACPGKSD